MTQRTMANINPDILVWARQTSGFSIDEAAKKIGISSEKLQLWEKGEGKPTIKQLRNVGKVYRRPTALFYATITPAMPPTIPDFRLIHEQDTENEYSSNIRFEIRRAFERREIALELTNQLGEEPPEFNLYASISDDPKTVADKIREELGVTIKTQYSWNDHYTALREWISAVEKLGVLVFHVSNVEIEKMRGFSIGEYPYPVVAINAKDSPRGRIFTLFHELTHIVLHNSGLCDLHEPELNLKDSIEVYCNRVAGEILVPSESILQEDEVKENTGKQWDEWRLSKLSNRYMVSQEVILRRLLILGRTTEDFYNQKHKEYIELYKRQKEEEQGGFIRYHKRILRDNGPFYTNLVLSAYQNEAISSRDLSNFLGGIKLDHINKIQQDLIGRGIMKGGEI